MIESRSGVVFACLFTVDLLADVIRGVHGVGPGNDCTDGTAEGTGTQPVRHYPLVLSLACSPLSIPLHAANTNTEYTVIRSSPYSRLQADKPAIDTSY